MLNLNWVDYLILAILLFYSYEGYSSGFIGAVLDLANFIISFLVGLRAYGFFAGILVTQLSIPKGFADAIGFFAITFIAEIILGILIKTFFTFELRIFKRLNNILGIVPGILSGLIIITFILVIAISLPVSKPIKSSISSSRLGGILLANTQGLEKNLKKVFGGAITETINFLTVEPKSSEIVSLNFKTSNFSLDPTAEQYMFELINKERLSRGLSELVFDEKLTQVGRNHCKDMLRRGYFSHYSPPQGFSPFDRMDEAGIVYSFAAENLALSPNADFAMNGFMQSTGHKANILSPNFGRVGIGVIDGGIYGEMFCQEFTD